MHVTLIDRIVQVSVSPSINISVSLYIKYKTIRLRVRLYLAKGVYDSDGPPAIYLWLSYSLWELTV